MEYKHLGAGNSMILNVKKQIRELFAMAIAKNLSEN